jgi:uncharacterized protein YlxW (UPF0749 family)
MPLTLNQFLFLIITFAFVIAVVFLVRLFAQLRKTAAEGEKALAEFRELAKSLNELDLLVKSRVEDLGKTLEAAKKAAINLSEASFLVTSKIIRPSSKYLLLLIPAARLVWRHLKKRKENKNGE